MNAKLMLIAAIKMAFAVILLVLLCVLALKGIQETEHCAMTLMSVLVECITVTQMLIAKIPKVPFDAFATKAIQALAPNVLISMSANQVCIHAIFLLTAQTALGLTNVLVFMAIQEMALIV